MGVNSVLSPAGVAQSIKPWKYNPTVLSLHPRSAFPLASLALQFARLVVAPWYRAQPVDKSQGHSTDNQGQGHSMKDQHLPSRFASPQSTYCSRMNPHFLRSPQGHHHSSR